MAQDDIDNGRLICIIGVASLMPAEFVIFRLTQLVAGPNSPRSKKARHWSQRLETRKARTMRNDPLRNYRFCLEEPGGIQQGGFSERSGFDLNAKRNDVSIETLEWGVKKG